MSSGLVIVGKVGGQDATEMAFIENDDGVKTLSAYRAHKALNIGILPRRLGCRENFLDGEALNTTAEVVTVDTVAVAHHVLGRRVLGECLKDLLGGPVCAGVAGDVPVQDTSAIVGEDEKDVEDAKGRGGHGEKVDRGEGTDMVVEEGSPGLRGRLASHWWHEAGDAALADIDAELEQFTVNSWRSPRCVGFGHLADEGLGLLGDLVLRRRAWTRLPTPEKAEASAVPADDGVWLDDDQDIRPARPQARQNEPKGAVGHAHAWAT